MSEIVKIHIENIIPNENEILTLQGIPESIQVNPRVIKILKDALDLLSELASPISIFSDISIDNFRKIFLETNITSKENPVIEDIYHKAKRLSLFAFTLGNAVSKKISKLFSIKDFALASMLDSAASAAADKGSEYGENFLKERLNSESVKTDDNSVLLYSPGYCGWDIKAQKPLFNQLSPEKIGISLNSHFLMTPIKSITGILIAGKRKIHFFKNNYSFCKECSSKSCRARLLNLR